MKLGGKHINELHLTYIGIALPIIAYITVFLKYNIYAPLPDDYFIIYDFLNQWVEAANFSDRLDLFLFSPHEHINITSRIIALFIYYLTGELSIQVYNFAGQIPLLIFCGIILIQFAKVEKSKAILLAIIMLSLSYYKFVVDALMVTQHAYTLLFCYISLIMARKNKYWSFGLSMFFAALATFTFGHGIITFAVVGLFFILQKQYIKAAACVIIGAFVFYIFLAMNQHAVEGKKMISLYITLRYFVHLMGNYALGLLYPSFLLGLAGFTWFCYLIYKRAFLKEPFLFSMLIFFALTIVSITYGRSDRGVYDALCPKYSFYSAMSIAFMYMISIKLKMLDTKKIIALSIIFVSLWSFNFSKSTRLLPVENQFQKEGIARYKATGKELWRKDFWNDVGDVQICTIAKKSEELGILNFK